MAPPSPPSSPPLQSKRLDFAAANPYPMEDMPGEVSLLENNIAEDKNILTTYLEDGIGFPKEESGEISSEMASTAFTIESKPGLVQCQGHRNIMIFNPETLGDNNITTAVAIQQELKILPLNPQIQSSETMIVDLVPGEIQGPVRDNYDTPGSTSASAQPMMVAHNQPVKIEFRDCFSIDGIPGAHQVVATAPIEDSEESSENDDTHLVSATLVDKAAEQEIMNCL